jgi:hypothetical protein
LEIQESGKFTIPFYFTRIQVGKCWVRTFHFQSNCCSFRYEYQFVDVGDYDGHGEMSPNPFFYQNLGEAEYVVAVYMYMRLLGYSISS